jgi:glycosyltransferase involved in cell wall biosynthesis
VPEQKDDRRQAALFWAYDLDAPSFRHRMAPVRPELERRGWRCEVEALPQRRYVRRILERRARLRDFDVLVMHRIKATPLELIPLRRASRRIVYDVDDAIYFHKPRRLGEEPDRSWLRQYKFARTCRAADLVIAGNRTLASVAARSTSRVEIVPTPVDLDNYERAASSPRAAHTLVWIGLPENLVYLEIVRPVLSRLAQRYPLMRLRVVSSDFPDWPGIPIERVSWSQATESQSLLSAGIGIMPLTDDDWTRGKCAFKLLQYMAAGLPCVGSNVGANRDVVVEGLTGFLASTAAHWERALGSLLDDAALAARMGEAGRERVRQHYDRRIVARRVADLIEATAVRSATSRLARAGS